MSALSSHYTCLSKIYSPKIIFFLFKIYSSFLLCKSIFPLLPQSFFKVYSPLFCLHLLFKFVHLLIYFPPWHHVRYMNAALRTKCLENTVLKQVGTELVKRESIGRKPNQSKGRGRSATVNVLSQLQISKFMKVWGKIHYLIVKNRTAATLVLGKRCVS